jgi:hypothetical protein
VSNGPTEALNNLIKRVKRAAFGFTSFRNYRVRALLYAGSPGGRYWPRSVPIFRNVVEAVTPRIS